MIPASFDYVAPDTLDQAIALLKEKGSDAKILTGGHSLIPLLKLRLARPSVVIDLQKIESLRGIRSADGGLEIGAATTHAEIEHSDEVQRTAPLLCETAGQIGDVQVRNVGTIGGSVVHADPASDWPAALLAAGATMVLVGPSGERTVAAEDFFVGLLESAARAGEILTAVRIPAPDQPQAGQPGQLRGSAYRKLAQSASGFALAGAAVQVTLRNGTIASARIGVTGVADHAYRPQSVEDALSGAPADEEAVGKACASAAEGVQALGDLHASPRYRAHLAVVLTKRAVLTAIERASGSR